MTRGSAAYPHYEVLIIETHSKHRTREEASTALARLPSRRRSLALVLEVPPLIPATQVKSPAPKNPNLKLKKATKRK